MFWAAAVTMALRARSPMARGMPRDWTKNGVFLNVRNQLRSHVLFKSRGPLPRTDPPEEPLMFAAVTGRNGAFTLEQGPVLM